MQEGKAEIFQEMFPCKTIIFQKERGNETGVEHFQGYLKVTSKLRAKQVAKMLNPYLYGIEVSPAV